MRTESYYFAILSPASKPDDKLFLNFDHIVAIIRNDGEDCTLVRTVDGKGYVVTEEPEEIFAKMKATVDANNAR